MKRSTSYTQYMDCHNWLQFTFMSNQIVVPCLAEKYQGIAQHMFHHIKEIIVIMSVDTDFEDDDKDIEKKFQKNLLALHAETFILWLILIDLSNKEIFNNPFTLYVHHTVCDLVMIFKKLKFKFKEGNVQMFEFFFSFCPACVRALYRSSS
eukprot:Lithocolla_globosa_v1_NODE_1126_length_2850_cov_20.371735.p3 type:complete len:151 gc:universal NODE_1126_length_2850_cov_20.371735:442-894(+)